MATKCRGVRFSTAMPARWKVRDRMVGSWSAQILRHGSVIVLSRNGLAATLRGLCTDPRADDQW